MSKDLTIIATDFVIEGDEAHIHLRLVNEGVWHARCTTMPELGHYVIESEDWAEVCAKAVEFAKSMDELIAAGVAFEQLRVQLLEPFGITP